jgi:hypothetical protein
MIVEDKERLIEYVLQRLKDPTVPRVQDQAMDDQILAVDHPPLWMRRMLLQRSTLGTLGNLKTETNDQPNAAEIMLTLGERMDILSKASSRKIAKVRAMLAVQTEVERQLRSLQK